jgi:hypothetical protein
VISRTDVVSLCISATAKEGLPVCHGACAWEMAILGHEGGHEEKLNKKFRFDIRKALTLSGSWK